MADIQNLKVWKKSILLAKDTYILVKDIKDFGLKEQIQRSAVSIASNIAEGYERETDKEFMRFLYIARGSCSELRTQLIIIQEVYTSIDIPSISEQLDEVYKMINSLIKKIGKDIRG
jgi:four helix bundle protein